MFANYTDPLRVPWALLGAVPGEGCCPGRQQSEAPLFKNEKAISKARSHQVGDVYL